MRHVLSALILAMLLCACGKPVPQERSAYIGQWEGPEMRLTITQEGSVRYQRRKAGSTVSIDGPLQGFEGDNFVVGVGPMTTTFIVSRPPYLDGATWRMVVDGVPLTRKATEGANQASLGSL